jgi:hypothetical protein
MDLLVPISYGLFCALEVNNEELYNYDLATTEEFRDNCTANECQCVK